MSNSCRVGQRRRERAEVVRIVTVLAAVVLVTLPFGFYRAYTRKLSLRWFLAIHLPVILVVLLRVGMHLPYVFIPFTFLAFTAAQFAGARAGQWWIRRHPARVAVSEALPRDKRGPGTRTIPGSEDP
jgi:small-conductance mechanosensitive channel